MSALRRSALARRRRIRRSRRARRQGLTLVELLVVVGIALAITAIAIPVLIPSQDERRMYEAGREVSGIFQTARTSAIETGRPVGVMLNRVEGLPQAVFTLSLAEVPPTYSGGFEHSRVNVLPSPVNPNYGLLGIDSDASGTIEAGERDSAFTDRTAANDWSWVGLIRHGDVLKINYQGHLYAIIGGEPFEDQDGDETYDGGEPYADVDGDGAYTAPVYNLVDGIKYIDLGTLWVISSETAPLAPTSPAYADLTGDGTPDVGGLPYQIIRQPVPSAGTSVELPETIAIDLNASGQEGFIFADPNGDTDFTNDGRSLTILYQPGGTIGSILWANRAIHPTTPIFLLLGRRELLPQVTGQENWRDLTNRWIGISVASGQVSTSENFVEPVAPALRTLSGARRLAREAQGSLATAP